MSNRCLIRRGSIGNISSENYKHVRSRECQKPVYRNDQYAKSTALVRSYQDARWTLANCHHLHRFLCWFGQRPLIATNSHLSRRHGRRLVVCDSVDRRRGQAHFGREGRAEAALDGGP